VTAKGSSTGKSIATHRTSYRAFMQTDARIDASNSGGPLVNTAGEVVGIATALGPHARSSRYAVPIDLAKQVFPMLERDGVVSRAWLGVYVHPVSADRSKAIGMEGKGGALVSDVLPGSPAARAGIRAGDVILQFDGKDIDHKSLPWLASTVGIGRTIKVSIWRGSASRTLELITEKMPE
jgi:serine protease Do